MSASKQFNGYELRSIGAEIYSSLTFLPNLHIMLVSPQPSHPSIHFFLLKKISSAAPPRGDLIKDTPLRDIKRRKKPSTRQESNPRPQEFCSAGMCSTDVPQPLSKLSNSILMKFNSQDVAEGTLGFVALDEGDLDPFAGLDIQHLNPVAWKSNQDFNTKRPLL